MSMNRRTFLQATAATTGITVLPFGAMAAAHAGHQFETKLGPVKVHPVAHASVVLETPVGVIYVDPVGNPAQYADFPDADIILVTHAHGDHLDGATLLNIHKAGVPIVINQAGLDKMPADLWGDAAVLENGGKALFTDFTVEAVAAYNTTAERLNFHPQGRDNGYVISMDGFRIYLSGDTEGVPEMRALKDIDLAFVCMNLPFTMDAAAAADAVAEFSPTYVYPYHYRGRDGGTQDPQEFARLIGDKAEVKFGNWYG